MRQIEIALASSKRYQAIEKVIADVPTTFTWRQNFPDKFLKLYADGWLIMCGMRPLLGDEHAQGEAINGRHWVAIDPSNVILDKIVGNNDDLKARIVLMLPRETIIDMVLLDGKYADAYRERIAEEGIEAVYNALNNRISKIEGLPFKEIRTKLHRLNPSGW